MAAEMAALSREAAEFEAELDGWDSDQDEYEPPKPVSATKKPPGKPPEKPPGKPPGRPKSTSPTIDEEQESQNLFRETESQSTEEVLEEDKEAAACGDDLGAKMEVEVPEGSAAGQTLALMLPNGDEIEVVIPDGLVRSSWDSNSMLDAYY